MRALFCLINAWPKGAYEPTASLSTDILTGAVVVELTVLGALAASGFRTSPAQLPTNLQAAWGNFLQCSMVILPRSRAPTSSPPRQLVSSVRPATVRVPHAALAVRFRAGPREGLNRANTTEGVDALRWPPTPVHAG